MWYRTDDKPIGTIWVEGENHYFQVFRCYFSNTKHQKRIDRLFQIARDATTDIDSHRRTDGQTDGRTKTNCCAPNHRVAYIDKLLARSRCTETEKDVDEDA